MNATQRLARFAVDLNYRAIPAEVIDRAKVCILDTLAVSLYGSTKPWSRTVSGMVRDLGIRGRRQRLWRACGALRGRWPFALWPSQL